ncbi:MAG TPA: NAD-dependent epimerase/dehydratase family protein [Gemmatimonadota bacterium]|nr:NAD-dependent epimerase/dehydratase family protein [Gemmatimonadota bacterium]
MRILVIGGTLFMGPRLVRSLVGRGHAVTTFHRGTTPGRLPAEVERLHGDRTDPAELRDALAGRSFDACVDTIAMRGADTASAVDLLYGRVGHYVHFSTGQVYLVRRDCPSPAREEDYGGPLATPPAPDAWDAGQWEYGIEKRECEDLLEEAWSARGFPATRLRLTMVHGEDDPRGRIHGYVLRLLDGGPLLVPVEPSPPIRPIHADAVVETVVRVVEEGSGKGAAYNLAQGEAWTHEGWIDRVAGMLGVEAVRERRPREELLRAGVFPACAPLANPWMSVLDPGRAARELGFRPGGFEEWLPAVVERVAREPWPAGGESARAREIALVG